MPPGFLLAFLASLENPKFRFRRIYEINSSKLFIKTGLIDKRFKDIYIRAMEERMIADYEALSTLSKEKAVDRLKKAREFIDMAQRYLQKNGLLK